MKRGKHNSVSKDVNKGESNKLLRKSFLKLKHKALYIDLEYQDTAESFKQAQSSFISSMFQFCSERKIKPPLDDRKKKEDKGQVDDLEGIKDLYREIVKLTHPDKTLSLSEEEINERSELYNEAVEGKKNGDFWAIFKTALELDIPVENLSFEYLVQIEESIAKLEEKMLRMKGDLMYKWFFCEESAQLDIFDKITANQDKYE